MRTPFILACIGAAVGISTAATAQSTDPLLRRGRFDVDVRLGVAVPAGDFVKNQPVGDSIAAQVPLGIGAGYRWPSGAYLGAYVSYGVLLMKQGSFACPPSWTSCRGHEIRAGGEFLYHLRSNQAVDPWFGFGIGYEWLTYHASLAQSQGELTDTVELEGGEYLNMQLGVDFAVTRALSIGPFVTFTIATYEEATLERAGTATSPPTRTSLSSTTHEWIFFGARGVLDVL